MRLALGTALAAMGLGFVAASGCMNRSNSGALAPSPRPSALATSRVSTPSGETQSSRPAEPDTSIDPSPTITAVVDDPRLGSVKTLLNGSDYAGAAVALEGARLALQPTPEDDTRWAYLAGRLRVLAGDPVGAARAFDDAGRRAGPLQAYANLGAAQALLRSGQVEQAKLRADQIPESCAVYPSAQLLVAEALALRGDHAGAAALYDRYLATHQHPARWVEVALRAGEAWLNASSDGSAAVTAARLARRVMVEAPTSSAVARAVDLHQRALRRLNSAAASAALLRPLLPRGKAGAMLPSDWARGLTWTEQLTRATALADQLSYSDAERALEALASVMGSGAATIGSEVGCRAEVLRGALLGKERQRPRAADAYGAAIARCASFPDVLVEALYFGGKASSSAGRCEEALVRFARVEAEFPGHRLADDARLRGAECSLELGDEQRYGDALIEMATTYPEGDMAPEGLFRLALRKMALGDWAGSLPLLESAQAFKLQEGPSSSGGRLAYFLARARYGSGDAEGGRRGYTAVVRDYPLSYYMLQAYARLAELDAAGADEQLQSALVREAPGSLVEGSGDLLQQEGVARAIELLRAGETDFAKRELTRLGARTDDPAGSVLWTIATVYARAGLPQMSHQIPRSRVLDWLGHYPAGRWRAAWELAYPRAYAEVVEREAKKNGIPAALAYAVMREESAFDPEAQSPARAFGLMQLIVPTAKRVGKDVGISCDEASLVQPETNVALGCRFLADLRAKFPVNPHVAISAYNAGPGASLRWLAARGTDDFDLWVERIPYEETRKYTKRVLASFAAYAFLYDRDSLAMALRLPKNVVSP